MKMNLQLFGGRGAGSGRASGGYSKMSDTQLESLDKELTGKMDIAKQKLLVISEQVTPSRENPTGKMPQEYYDVRTELSDLQKSYGEVAKEMADRKHKKAMNEKSTKTFVNSYGEATKRNITTASYERSQRKLSKQIMRYVGGN